MSNYNIYPAVDETTMEFHPAIKMAQAKSSENMTQIVQGDQAVINEFEPRVSALETMNGVSPESPTDGQTASLITQNDTQTRQAIDGLIMDERDRLALVSLHDFGAVGDGVTDDTTAWNEFQAVAQGIKIVPAGRYLVNGAIRRFDRGVIGNGDFEDANSAWDQPRGDRERDSLIVHRRDINADTQALSPAIKTQTHVNFERDVPSGSFKHVVGAYHEATLDGYYNTQADTNQNFTVTGATVRNRMAGLFGSLAHLAYVEDATETEQPLIETMGASKNGCQFLRFTRKAKHENGGYMFGQEIYCQNQADETLAVPYENNDEYSFNWTTGMKISAYGAGAPISSAIFTNGGTSKHGFWNGIVIGSTGFKINGDGMGVPGTVGINLASWRESTGYADIGIKFRKANRHLYFRDGTKIRTSKTRFMYEAGASGISIESADGFDSYLTFGSGVTDAPDGGSVYQTHGHIDMNASRAQLESDTGEVHISAKSGVAIYAANEARFAPAVANDAALQLGGSNRRWDNIYAANGVINTSDERKKMDITEIPDNVLDAWGEVGYKQYRFTEAVNAKGSGRLHTGLVAQRIEKIFADRALNANDYGLLCYDEWEATPEIVNEQEVVTKEAVYEQVLIKEAEYRDVLNSDGSVEKIEIAPAEYTDGKLLEPAVTETRRTVIPAVEAGSLFGIRYEEASAMEAAFQRRRADRLEARITNLEMMVGQ